ncbi:MAG: AAA family ATPase [Phycisphaerales bacterium]|nr:AAA family ATPase [Phycisphaerales bacterium]
MNPNGSYQFHSQWIDRLAEEARILGEARMLRDDQELTPEIEAAIIRRVKDYQQRSGKSQQVLARAFAISPATVSEILAGTYKGDSETIIRRVDKGLEQLLVKEAAPKVPGFLKTSAALDMIGLAKRVHRIGGIGIITGPSGCGKSMTAEFLRSEIIGSILIRITTAGASKLAVLDMIARQLRITGLKLTAYQVEQQIFAILKNSGRMIIVDEAHKLTLKRRDEGLHCLRDLHDEAGCPLMLIGTANLKTYVQGGASEFEALDQVFGRTSCWLDLSEKLAAGEEGGGGGGTLHSVDDIRLFLSSQQIKLVRDESGKVGENEMGMTDDAVMYLVRKANERAGGCLRVVKWLVLLARDHGKPGAIVNAASLDLLQGRRIGLSLHRAQSSKQAIIEARQQRATA